MLNIDMKDIQSGHLRIDIFNIQGQKVLSKSFTSEKVNDLKLSIDVSDFIEGVYLIQIHQDNKRESIKIWI